MNVKWIKIIWIIILLLAFIIFSLYGYFKEYHRREKFKEMQYNGIIIKVIEIEGNRGYPAIMLNDQLINLGLDWGKVVHHIQEGDSIVKEPGSMIFKVYRKNSNGEWDESIFK